MKKPALTGGLFPFLGWARSRMLDAVLKSGPSRADQGVGSVAHIGEETTVLRRMF
jgi:hypothetical protein